MLLCLRSGIAELCAGSGVNCAKNKPQSVCLMISAFSAYPDVSATGAVDAVLPVPSAWPVCIRMAAGRGADVQYSSCLLRGLYVS